MSYLLSINFNFGSFAESNPNCFDWITLIFTIIGVVGAFIIYYLQRIHNWNEAHGFLLDYLEMVNKALEDSIKNLNDFKSSLQFSNDKIENLVLSSNLTDIIFQKINIIDLNRHYKCFENKNHNTFKEFVKKSSFISVYHSYFQSIMNDFTQKFSTHQQIYKKYNLLWSSYYKEIKNSKSATSKYFLLYEIMRTNTQRNPCIVVKGEVINRDLFVSDFVRNIGELSFHYIGERAYSPWGF